MEGKVDMIKSTISLQDLSGEYTSRRRLNWPGAHGSVKASAGRSGVTNGYMRNWDFDDYVHRPKPSSAKAIPA